ncbi:VOC family protein [Streptomyces sp. JJ36]|uniref:VOC family protein n=1 Tax=Streptomyces sp. JJ36 TaxID=2736645 RepID=UPI001F326811|nr:VOC family protein [Streptomyces sp. JJ36]MCF6522780.1 VOC family protein [Streptomyces sp. JJ36]
MTEAATGHGHTPGTPCWASLMVRDLARTRDFYHALFGWEFRTGPQPLGPYVRAVLGGREVAGLGEMARGRDFRSAWIPYLAGDDADGTAALIRDCGGTVAVGPLDADSAGRMAVAADPSCATFGVWQAGTHPGMGAGEAGAPGTPVWFELTTREAAPAAKFYSAVFGFDTAETGREDPEEGDLLVLRLRSRPVASVRGVGSALPRGQMPQWETCFAVTDPDAAAHRAAELGGRVVREPRDLPYGRRATVVDPEGARFSVIRRVGGAR